MQSCRGRDGGSRSGGPRPSSLVTEGSGEPVPDPGPTLCSISEVAGASTSHPGTAGLMGVALRTPIAEFPQMLGATGAIDNPDVYAECDVALEARPEARPTQPPHPQQIVDAEDLELYGSPDTVNIEDILSVDVTPLSSISTSGMDATACSDMSVARSVSVDLGTSMAVDFDDRSREIPDTAAAMLELADTAAMAGATCFRNPSILWCMLENIHEAKLLQPMASRAIDIKAFTVFTEQGACPVGELAGL